MSKATTPCLQYRFSSLRHQTEHLASDLSDEDMIIQSMPDTSPTKWHLAHTTWFFEEFVLSRYLKHYTPFDPQYQYLFNSYYETVGKRHQRPLRGLLSRPPIKHIMQYRAAVNEQVSALLDNNELLQAHKGRPSPAELIELGLHHEMQHQELLLTDILHALSIHPFHPQIKQCQRWPDTASLLPLKFHRHEGLLCSIGHNGPGFHYDCEGPQHAHYLTDFSITNRLITNKEWIEFIEDDGYKTPTLWLSDGWTCCQKEQWQAPLYWLKKDNTWFQFGLDGLRPVNPTAPVCHISYYEADAFASWAGCRLPTEQEWESLAGSHNEIPNITGNFLDQELWRPQPHLKPSDSADRNPYQLFGDVWEWTQSPYAPYPGFKTPDGAIGEYNGKFMCNQFVLRGGSCVTPHQQIRHTYRNFFYPHQRWQFSGLRLASNP